MEHNQADGCQTRPKMSIAPLCIALKCLQRAVILFALVIKPRAVSQLHAQACFSFELKLHQIGGSVLAMPLAISVSIDFLSTKAAGRVKKW